MTFQFSNLLSDGDQFMHDTNVQERIYTTIKRLYSRTYDLIDSNF